MSLARLLEQQGSRDEARTMLAEIYDWFTEGFDTRRSQGRQGAARRAERVAHWEIRQMRCAKCSSDNPAGKKFCGDCGARLAHSCPKCGAENPESKKFCGDCGAPLAAGSRTTPSPGAAPPGIGGAPSAISLAVEPVSGEIPEGERKTVTALFARHQGLYRS